MYVSLKFKINQYAIVADNLKHSFVSIFEHEGFLQLVNHKYDRRCCSRFKMSSVTDMRLPHKSFDTHSAMCYKLKGRNEIKYEAPYFYFLIVRSVFEQGQVCLLYTSRCV